MTPTLTSIASEPLFPEALEFLFQPAPYKVAYGGRGATKSWGFARALLIEGTKRKLRILAARETMKSIRDSVHQLLETQIQDMNLEPFYRVEKSVIYGTNGTEILFTGLKHNIDNVKSMEAIDICWVEEAQTVTKTSWDKLIPTLFRVPGCELWISFNPDLESDATYQRFVVNPPQDAIVRKLTYRDNPWFPEGLRRELEEARRRDPDEFAHIWEGSCINTLANAIYANELRAVDVEGRIRRVPYDPQKPVDTAWDLGFGDMVSIWMYQQFPLELRIIDYEEGVRQPIHYYISELQKRGYMWGTDNLPWDGGLGHLGTGKSIAELMKTAGRRVRVAARLPVVDGINAARTIFPLCYFDEARCAAGIRSLRCYRYGDMKSFEGPTREPLHDVHCLVPETLVLTKHGKRRIMDLQGEEVLTPCGWSTYRGPWITQRNAPLVEVRFVDGNTARCTPEHLFLTESGWRSAEFLTPGTLIQLCSIPSSNTSMGRYTSDGQVPFITAELNATFIEESGRVHLGQFQKVVTSIIETIILPITASPIWNAYPNLNIHSNRFIVTRPFLNQPEKGLRHGTALKQGGSGIDSKPEDANRGGSVNASPGSANSATLNLWRSFATSIRRGFVQRNADHPAVAESTTPTTTTSPRIGRVKPNIANTAASSSWPLFAPKGSRNSARSSAEPLSTMGGRLPAAQSTVGSGNRRSVTSAASNLWRWFARLIGTGSVPISAESIAIASVKHLTERADTCCIEVPDVHCFALANGAIVHNSHCADAFRTLAVSIRQPQKEREREQQRMKEYASPWS